MARKEISKTTISYVDDYEYSIQILRWILKPISAWPVLHMGTLLEKVYSGLLVLVCTFLILFTCIPCAMGMIYDTTQSIDDKLKDNCGPILFWLMGILKYSSLIFHMNDICRCLEHMKVDWKLIKRIQDKNVMLQSAKTGRFIAAFCALFVHTGVYSFNIGKEITSSRMPRNNESIHIRVLPYPFYNEILDTRFSPAYEIVYLVQYLSAFVVNSVTAGSCSLAAVFVMHAHGQFKVLTSWFDDLVYGNEGKHDTVRRRLATIVKSHLRVLSFALHIEEIMHLTCLVEILGSTMVMCLLGFNGIKEWNLKHQQNVLAYSMIFISLCFNIFVYCQVGEILAEQSKAIGLTAYMIEWYHLPGKSAGDLVLIILRSNSVIKFTAGKMIQLSLSTFADVLKTALAYFNMLRAVI